MMAVWFVLGWVVVFLISGLAEAGKSARHKPRRKKKNRERGENKLKACDFRELGRGL